MVKTVRAKYFSDLIEKCRIEYNSRVLFSTLNAAMNPPASDGIDVSVQTCENFRTFSMDKIADIRSSFQPSDHDPSVPPSTCSAVFHQFEPVSISTLAEIVKHY